MFGVYEMYRSIAMGGGATVYANKCLKDYVSVIG